MKITERRLSWRTGSEGPKHDPYSFTEMTVTLNGVDHTLHMGLGMWYAIDGQHQEFDRGSGSWQAMAEDRESATVQAWTNAVGMNPAEFEDAYWKAHPYFKDPMGCAADYE